MILELETLAKLPAKVRADIERYCEWRGCSYSLILSACERDYWAGLKREGLIIYLAARRYKLADIAIAAGVDKDTAERLIKQWRERKEIPIRTVNYERLALCRR